MCPTGTPCALSTVSWACCLALCRIVWNGIRSTVRSSRCNQSMRCDVYAATIDDTCHVRIVMPCIIRNTRQTSSRRNVKHHISAHIRTAQIRTAQITASHATSHPIPQRSTRRTAEGCTPSMPHTTCIMPYQVHHTTTYTPILMRITCTMQPPPPSSAHASKDIT